MGPLRVDGFEAEDAEIESKIGDIHGLAVGTEGGARRKQQAVWLAVAIDARKITELGERLAGLVDDDDFVRLIGSDPYVVIGVDSNAVGAVDAVGEDARGPRRAVSEWNLNELVVAGIGDKHHASGIVELDTVGAEGWQARGRQQRILHPNLAELLHSGATAGPNRPNDP